MKIELPPSLVELAQRYTRLVRADQPPASTLTALNAAAYLGEQLAALVQLEIERLKQVCTTCGNDRAWHHAHRPRHLFKEKS